MTDKERQEAQEHLTYALSPTTVITNEEQKRLETRLAETLKKLSQEPAEFWWGDAVRQVEHIHLMDGEYDGAIIYLFNPWYDKHGYCNIFLDTRTGCIDGSIRNITDREICHHHEVVSKYWKNYFKSIGVHHAKAPIS